MLREEEQRVCRIMFARERNVHPREVIVAVQKGRRAGEDVEETLPKQWRELRQNTAKNSGTSFFLFADTCDIFGVASYLDSFSCQLGHEAGSAQGACPSGCTLQSCTMHICLQHLSQVHQRIGVGPSCALQNRIPLDMVAKRR